MSVRADRAAGLAAALAITVALAPADARADEGGVYGRLDGDLTLRAGAGAAFAEGGPSLAVRAAALYLGSAGLYAHYTDALGAGGPLVTRSIATGVHVAPLFLARFGKNLEKGPAHLDLFLDSLGFELGAFWAAPRGFGLQSRPGLELALSLSVPILPRATGPFIGLRGALRWRDADLCCRLPGDALDRGAFFGITLDWHHVIATHLVDAGDRQLR